MMHAEEPVVMVAGNCGCPTTNGDPPRQSAEVRTWALVIKPFHLHDKPSTGTFHANLNGRPAEGPEESREESREERLDDGSKPPSHRMPVD